MMQNELIRRLRETGVVVTPRMVLNAIADGRLDRPPLNGARMYEYDESHLRRLDELYRRQPKENP